jgi:hypothetical protein
MARIARKYLMDMAGKCFSAVRKVMFAGGEHKFAAHEHNFACEGKRKFWEQALYLKIFY